MNQDEVRGKSLWKFHNLLALNYDFVDKMEAHTGNIQKNLDKENVRDNQVDGNIQNMKLENF